MARHLSPSSNVKKGPGRPKGSTNPLWRPTQKRNAYPRLCYLSPEDYEDLRWVTRVRHTTMSDVMREALQRYVADEVRRLKSLLEDKKRIKSLLISPQDPVSIEEERENAESGYSGISSGYRSDISLSEMAQSGLHVVNSPDSSVSRRSLE